MTIDEFKSRFGIELIKFFAIDGFLYTEPMSVKLEINKNIVLEDLKNKSQLSILSYFDGHVMTKDGTIQPYGIKLSGNWTSGYALDYHTLVSAPSGSAANGRIIWDTKRPPLAEDLYRLKYWREQHRVEKIARPAADFLKKFKNIWQLDLIMPVPPSDTTRENQPVFDIANFIGQLLSVTVDVSTLKKIKSTSQLKGIDDPSARREILKDAFSIHQNALLGKNILVFDDLYRSGETLNAVCDILKNIGMAKSLYVLTITKTRSKR